METKTYFTTDKYEWGEGPWRKEPDKLQFADEATGLPCLMVRNHQGAWCGYVGVSKGHPLYEKDYSEASNIDVHGGLTFADHCHDGIGETHAICHVVEPGEDDNVWWLGFDCAHGFDRTPAIEEFMKDAPFYSDYIGRSYYWDMERVKQEVTKLATQLAAMS